MIRVLILTFFLSLSLITSAQKPFTIGPLVGMTSSTLHNSDYTSSKAGSGYALGGFMRIAIKKLYLQPNIYYLQNASSFDDNQNTVDTKLKTVNYEALLGYRIFKFTDLTYIRIFAGIGYANINTLKYQNAPPNLSSTPGSGNTTLNVGAGIDLWKFTFDLRYQEGLSDIDKSSNTMKTNMVMLTAGFKIL
jgi:hypothetical protein